MKQIIIRFLLAFAATLMAFALASSARAQQADEDPSPNRTQPEQQHPFDRAKPPAENAPEQNIPGHSTSEPETQEPLAFTGIIAKMQDEVVLKDPVTRMVYRFDDASKVEPYVGKQVRVVGKLGLDSNTIYVNSVEVIPQDERRSPEKMQSSSPTRTSVA